MPKKKAGQTATATPTKGTTAGEVNFGLTSAKRNPGDPGTPGAPTDAAPVETATAAHPHATLFTSRELSRLGTLSDEIVSLRARAADLLERATKNAGFILSLAVNDGRECSPELAAEVLRDIDATKDGESNVEPSFAFKARAHAAKCRAKFKLAAAQQEFEALRNLAGIGPDRVAELVDSLQPGAGSAVERLEHDGGPGIGDGEPVE